MFPKYRDPGEMGAARTAESGWAQASVLGPLAAAYLGYILVGAKALPGRVCPTYLLFGVNCPLCGLTSGCSEALHGHLGRASTRHWAAVPFTAAILAISFRWVWEVTR
jgi:hypothetical protein